MSQSFYQTPKSILQLPISSDAKLLMIELLDKFKLSLLPQNKKNFTDKDGTPFVRVARQTMTKWIGRSLPSVRKAINELVNVGVIVQKRLGLTKCNLYYLAGDLLEWVKNLVFSTERNNSLPSDAKQIPANNNNPTKNYSKSYGKQNEKKNYGKKGVLAQQYSQRHYDPSFFESMIEKI